MIGIYKIQNKINNKVYIGQSKNITYRFKRHIYDSKNGSSTLIHAAFRKYGIDNFDFSILQECSIEELNKLEQTYIQEYNSMMPNGYNMQIGGQPTKFQCYFKFKQADILEIYNMLLDTEKTFNEIANIYHVSSTMIQHINNGLEYCMEGYNYPIRSHDMSKQLHYQKVKEKLLGESSYKATINEDIVYAIIDDLTNNLSLTNIEIAKKYNTTIDIVKDINRYKSWKHIVRPKPCRPDYGNHKIILDDALFIIQKLKEPIAIQDIIKYNPLYNYKIIYRINKGETWKQENETYPIRNFTIGKGKLTIPQVLEIYDELALGTSIIELSNKYNISTQSMYDIKNYKSYSYLKEFYNPNQL